MVWPKVWHDWVMCTEGRDMYGHQPGDEEFCEEAKAAKFGLKEASHWSLWAVTCKHLQQDHLKGKPEAKHRLGCPARLEPAQFCLFFRMTHAKHS